MTDYTKTTDFAAKDSLPSGDSGKIVRGAEFETEFDNISTAIATKADLASPTFTGTVTIPTATVTTFTLGGTTVTATAAELNLLDGVTATTAELNILDGVTADASELNILDGVTATTAELNYLDITTLGTSEASKVLTTDSSNNVNFGDNSKAIFGAGNDLQIYHDGSNSRIQDAGTGNLLIRANAAVQLENTNGDNMLFANAGGSVDLYHNASKKLETTSTGINVTGNATFGDNGKAIFGAGSDLEIYHDGSNSFIKDTGSGGLRLSTNQFRVYNAATDELSINAVENGTVELYYDNSKKLATSSTGVDISGALTTDNGATIDETKTSATDSILTIRDNSDPNVEGELLKFQRNNGSGGYTNTGRLGYKTLGSDLAPTFFISGIDTALGFFNYITTKQIIPTDSGGNESDNQIDLGRSSARFDDIYATNSTIQTSDVNEKQDIDVLSNAERRVAVTAKGLLKKFRWRSAVEEKGDNARIHFGIIAQDLQTAFQAEGLDAGRYGMFVSETWTDLETNEEKSRMGVRYSELLAFIISAI